MSCGVPGYNSGRAKGRDKFFLFVLPLDQELLKQWERNILNLGRPLRRKGLVCARHFEKHFLNDRYFSEIGGNVLLDVKKVPRLRKGAVPTIFHGSNGAHVKDAKPQASHEQTSRTVDQLPLVFEPQVDSTAESCIKLEVDTCSEELIHYVGEKGEVEGCLGPSSVPTSESTLCERVGTYNGELDVRIKVESDDQHCPNAGADCAAVQSPHNKGGTYSVQHGCPIKAEVEEQCMDMQNPDALMCENVSCLVVAFTEALKKEQAVVISICTLQLLCGRREVSHTLMSQERLSP
ncbi:hypothetical protein V5799_023427 [Amblyomma americanum]|uniref:THAP-type domain-containing protein n=1 Tax=Amblyomma americanum TaxID=6943 RepID=A0AAQ4FJA7_AMBAM